MLDTAKNNNLGQTKLLLLAGLLALVAGLCWASLANRHKPEFSALEELPKSIALGEFLLQDQNGDALKPRNFKGHWSLVYFGFTSCPDLCPMELQQLAKVYHLLSPEQQQKLSILFVTVDPERDTGEKLQAYLHFFDPAFIGVSGSNRELAHLAKNFALYYQRSFVSEGNLMKVPAGIDMPTPLPEDYQVEHSSRIYVVNPKAEYLGSFPPPHQSNALLADIKLLLND